MPYSERRQTPPPEVTEAHNAMDDSIYNLNGADTTAWDDISQGFRQKQFATIDEFKSQMTKALSGQTWTDPDFPARMLKKLDNAILDIKTRQVKR